MQTSSNKYIKLAEKYMDNVARHYDPVPQEGAIIDFAIWLDKQAAELESPDDIAENGYGCENFHAGVKMLEEMGYITC